jgi:transcriptional regulator GlxA family with amidase domain
MMYKSEPREVEDKAEINLGRPELWRIPVTCTAAQCAGAPDARERQTTPSSTRHNSTNMDQIQAAIEAYKSQELGEQFSVQEVADKYSVWRSTMQRRMAGQTVSRIEQSTNAQKLSL